MGSIGKKYEIHTQLADALSHLYTINTPDNEPECIHHLSPSLEMMVVFNFGPPISFSFGNSAIGDQQIERIGILGPLRQMTNYKVGPGTDMLILPFILDGFFRFMPLPVDELSTGTLKETDVEKHAKRLEEIWEMLAGISEPDQRIEAMTAYLIHNLPKNAATQPLLEGLPDLHNPYLNAVKTIADKASLTERTVQARFKKYTGYSTKELVRFLRFKQVLAHILPKKEEEIDWFDLIHDFGYFDQSHLIKDFKYYTGVSPKKFLKLNKEGNFCVSRE